MSVWKMAAQIPKRLAFIKLIKAYDIYRPPYLEAANRLTDDQAAKNYKFFAEHKDERIQTVQRLLANYPIGLNPAKPDKRSLLALNAWAYEYWPWIYRKKVLEEFYYGFDFADMDARVRSLLFDVSVLLGECYLTLAKSASWHLDSGETSRREDRTTYNRIVILEKLGVEDIYRKPAILDMEAHVYFHYAAQKKSALSNETDRKMGIILSQPIQRLL